MNVEKKIESLSVLIENALRNGNLHLLLQKVFPTHFVSNHINVSSSLNDRFKTRIISSLFFLTVREWVKYFLHRKTNLHKRDYVIFVPNLKYEKYITILSKKLDVDYLIMSTESLQSDSINLKHFSNLLTLRSSVSTLTKLVKYLVYNKQNNNLEYSQTSKEIVLAYKLLHYAKVISFILSEIGCKVMVSFYPTGDFHNLLVLCGGDNLKRVICFRPESTSFYDYELNFIIGTDLFYKSYYEESIYKYYKLDERLTLRNGGIIIQKGGKLPVDFNKRILIIDTCNDKSTDSASRRHRSLDKVYQVILEIFPDYEILHKFHPGLDKISHKETIKFLESFKNVRIYENRDMIYTNIGFVISFYSTLLYDCCFHGIPFFLLDGYFNNSVARKYDLQEAPTVRVTNFDELMEIANLLSKTNDLSQVKSLLKTDRIREWFCSFYNYPKGIDEISDFIKSTKFSIFSKPDA